MDSARSASWSLQLFLREPASGPAKTSAGAFRHTHPPIARFFASTCAALRGGVARGFSMRVTWWPTSWKSVYARCSRRAKPRTGAPESAGICPTCGWAYISIVQPCVVLTPDAQRFSLWIGVADNQRVQAAHMLARHGRQRVFDHFPQEARAADFLVIARLIASQSAHASPGMLSQNVQAVVHMQHFTGNAASPSPRPETPPCRRLRLSLCFCEGGARSRDSRCISEKPEMPRAERVMVGPALMALTRTPCGPRSLAR